jgi:hypothetical protein
MSVSIVLIEENSPKKLLTLAESVPSSSSACSRCFLFSFSLTFIFGRRAAACSVSYKTNVSWFTMT